MNNRELISTLSHMGDDFILVEVNGVEYVIDSVYRKPNYTDSPCSHICIRCRDGGDGEVKR